jgi:hypothetical protein
LDEYQASMNQDRIQVRQIALSAEQIPGGQIGGSGFVAPAPKSAAAAFKEKTFKDGGGRYAILSRPIQQQKQTNQQNENTNSNSSSTHQIQQIVGLIQLTKTNLIIIRNYSILFLRSIKNKMVEM